MEDFGKTLAAIRTYRGMTQDQLAEASGVTENAIARYESERNQPRADTVVKLADALDCSVDLLLGRTPLVVKFQGEEA